jgi:acetyl-CoA carboxylase biotin carboxylase subunit
MYQAALCAVRTVGYDNIGTVEFIVTPEGDFYFLEMNTRLQVEHAVTEMITGIDLVALQIELATKRCLTKHQHDISRSGHAIQCRIYAENPYENFAPSSGILQLLFLPLNPFIRIEHDLAQGGTITPFFDPMIAKFVAHGSTRAESTSRLTAFLQQVKIEGIETNKNFLRTIMLSDEFVGGQFHTQLIASKEFMQKMGRIEIENIDDDVLAGIAVYLYEQELEGKAVTNSDQSNSHVRVRRWKDQQWR